MHSSARLDDLHRKFAEDARRYFAPLANEYRKVGEPRRAVELCQEQLRAHPGHLSGHVVLALALHDLHEREDARRAYAEALRLDPENLLVLRSLGDLAREQGDRDVARDWYERAMGVDPRDPEVARRLALLEEEQDAAPLTASDLTSSDMTFAAALAAAESRAERDEPDASEAIEAPDDASALPLASSAPESPFGSPTLDDATPSDEAARTDEAARADEAAPADDGAGFTAGFFATVLGEPTPLADDAPIPPPLRADAESVMGVFGDAAPAGGADALEGDDVDRLFADLGSMTDEFAPGATLAPGEDDAAAERAVQPDPLAELPALEQYHDVIELEEVAAPGHAFAASDAEEGDLADVEGFLDAELLASDLTSTTIPDAREEQADDLEPATSSESVGAPIDEEGEPRPLVAEEWPAIVHEHEPSRDVDAGGDVDVAASTTGDAAHNPGDAAYATDVAAENSSDAELEEAAAVTGAGDDWAQLTDAPTVEMEIAQPDSEETEAGRSVTEHEERDALVESWREESPSVAAETWGGEHAELAGTTYDTTDAWVEAPAASETFEAHEAPEAFEAPEAPEPAEASEAFEPERATPPAAFVTETMAELYLQQGLTAQALDVYRELSAQRPDDARLAGRVADVERELGSVRAARSPAGRPSHPDEPPASSWLQKLARARPSRVDVPAVPEPAAEGALMAGALEAPVTSEVEWVEASPEPLDVVSEPLAGDPAATEHEPGAAVHSSHDVHDVHEVHEVLDVEVSESATETPAASDPDARWELVAAPETGDASEAVAVPEADLGSASEPTDADLAFLGWEQPDAVAVEPVETAAADTEAVDAEAVEAEPMDAELVEVESLEVEAVGAEAFGAEAVEAEAVAVEPVETFAGEPEAEAVESAEAPAPAAAVAQMPADDDPWFFEGERLAASGETAAVESAPPAPVPEAAPVPAPAAAAPFTLDDLFARDVPQAEEHAAGALAAATVSMQNDPAVDAQLGEAASEDPASLAHVLRGTPRSVSALRQGASFSFDQFFQVDESEPAAPETKEPGRARDADSSSDLADFHAWLSGLSGS